MQMAFFSSPPTATPAATPSSRKSALEHIRAIAAPAGPSARDAHHGIISPQKNFAIVDKKIVGEAMQPLHGFRVVDGNGLFRNVPAGHHQRCKPASSKEQVMQRCVRQKNPKSRLNGATEGQSIPAASSSKNNGMSRALQQAADDILQMAEFFQAGKRGRHDRKGFFDAPLSLPQSRHGGFVHCIDGQVNPPGLLLPLFPQRQAAQWFLNGIGMFNSLPH